MRHPVFIMFARFKETEKGEQKQGNESVQIILLTAGDQIHYMLNDTLDDFVLHQPIN